MFDQSCYVISIVIYQPAHLTLSFCMKNKCVWPTASGLYTSDDNIVNLNFEGLLYKSRYNNNSSGHPILVHLNLLDDVL